MNREEFVEAAYDLIGFAIRYKVLDEFKAHLDKIIQLYYSKTNNSFNNCFSAEFKKLKKYYKEDEQYEVMSVISPIAPTEARIYIVDQPYGEEDEDSIDSTRTEQYDMNINDLEELTRMVTLELLLQNYRPRHGRNY